MDELDAQLTADLAAQSKGQEAQETQEEAQEVKEEVKQEAKTYTEDYVKALRAENAQRRIAERQLKESIPSIVQQEIQRLINPQQNVYPQGYQQPQPVYDPRVDDLMLRNKIAEIRNDEYFGEVFNEVDEEGRTFEQKLLERQFDTGWPVDELDALALKMDKERLFGRIKQKGIDEAYKNINLKAQTSADKTTTSGKAVEESEVKNIDDAIAKAKQELGVTDFKNLQ